MKAYTHIMGGILFFLILAYLLNISNPFLGVFCAAWISVFPNIVDKLTGKPRAWGHSFLWLIPMALFAIYSPLIATALVVGFLSHLLMDSFTVYGVPALYPFKKSGFVCLNKKRRFKTGSNQDKAVFIFLLFLIVPIILFTTGLGNFFLGENMNVAFAVSNQSNNSSISPQNSNIYLSFKLDEACNKNITFEKVNENKTSIVVQDINTTVKK
ncbi:MAG: hypothetical protein CVV28_02930 [Methanobacteriales archaeon HGW-Methanobacteriales-1]|jgi:inner membrane protein|nr:MAG: hypothetical protein CVV28_02930 [Methanobacteriales archaeon HGW-Methanobacteriales-1]